MDDLVRGRCPALLAEKLVDEGFSTRLKDMTLSVFLVLNSLRNVTRFHCGKNCQKGKKFYYGHVNIRLTLQWV